MLAREFFGTGAMGEEFAMTKEKFDPVATVARLVVVVGTTLVMAMTTLSIVAGQAAADVAGDWALTVDTDQGIVATKPIPELNSRQALAWNLEPSVVRMQGETRILHNTLLP